MDKKGDVPYQKQKIIRIIIITLVILSLICLLGSKFMSWRYGEVDTFLNDEQVGQQVDTYYLTYQEIDIDSFGIDTPPTKRDYSEFLEYANLSHEAPAYILMNGLLNLNTTWMITLVMMIITIIGVIFDYKKNGYKSSILLISISLVLVLLMLIYFYSLFPLGDELEQFSFAGESISDSSNNYWGPGMGWYSLIVIIIILFSSIGLLFISQRPEQVGGETDRLSED